MNNQTNGFPYDHFRSEGALRSGVLLWQIVSPILLVCGTIGNVLSVVVLSRKSMNTSVSSAYLLGLSVADLLVLHVGLLRQWLRYLTGFDIRTASNLLCKIHWWLLYVTLDLSVWLLTMVTIERVISTFKPFSTRILCTQKRAQVVIISVLMIVLAINSHVLYGMERTIVSSGNETVSYICGPTGSYVYFFSMVWNYIDLCKFSLIPFVILTLSNFCIIYKVVSNNRKMKRQVVPSTAAATHKKTSAMSKLLVTLNIVFIVCTAPVCVYLIGEPYWIPKDVPRNIQLEDPWWALVNILMYINNASNFILYCLSGSKFRRELQKLFKRRVHPEDTTFERSRNQRTALSSQINQNLNIPSVPPACSGPSKGIA